MSVEQQDNATDRMMKQGEERIRSAIIRMLTEFPVLTRTMLASHVSPYGAQYGIIWTEILEEMVAEGLVISGARPGLGGRSALVYSLPKKDRLPELLHTS